MSSFSYPLTRRMIAKCWIVCKFDARLSTLIHWFRFVFDFNFAGTHSRSLRQVDTDRWWNMGQGYCVRAKSSRCQSVCTCTSFNDKRFRRWIRWNEVMYKHFHITQNSQKKTLIGTPAPCRRQQQLYLDLSVDWIIYVSNRKSESIEMERFLWQLWTGKMSKEDAETSTKSIRTINWVGI